jgi:hypothetical protein
MTFSIHFERSNRFARVEVSGPASLKNHIDLIERAARDTMQHRDMRVLADLRGVIGRLGFTDQFFLGDVMSQQLAHLERLAVIVRDDPSTYIGPRVATRKGLSLVAFQDEAQAVAWLMEDVMLNASP